MFSADTLAVTTEIPLFKGPQMASSAKTCLLVATLLGFTLAGLSASAQKKSNSDPRFG